MCKGRNDWTHVGNSNIIPMGSCVIKLIINLNLEYAVPTWAFRWRPTCANEWWGMYFLKNFTFRLKTDFADLHLAVATNVCEAAIDNFIIQLVLNVNI